MASKAEQHPRYDEWFLAMTLRATFMCFEAWLARQEREEHCS